MTDNSKLSKHIDNFNGRKVLVLGDILLDEYIWGDAKRISPEAPVPVVNIQKREIRPGGAANVAMTIAKLGGIPVLAGVIGDDDTGFLFKKTVESNGISNLIMSVENQRITPRKTRIIASNQQMLRIDNEEVHPITDNSRDELISRLDSALAGVDSLLVSDYAKGLIESRLLSPVLDMAKSRDMIITVDPKPVNMHLYKGVTLVSPNLKEASISSGIEVSDRKSLRDAANKLIETITPKALLIPRGSDGLSLYTSDGDERHLPAMTSHVYDVSGAGDTLIGTLTLSMCAGADIYDATLIANCAASVVVRKPGVAVVDTEELREATRSRSTWENN